MNAIDLHGGNILFRSPNLDRLPLNELRRRLRSPYTLPVAREDGGPLGLEFPQYIMMPVSLGRLSMEPFEEGVIISDLGEAFLSYEEAPKSLNTPLHCLAPETLFPPYKLGPAVDIWSLGCIIYEILGHPIHLFNGFDAEEELPVEMVSSAFLGSFPKSGGIGGSTSVNISLKMAPSNPRATRLTRVSVAPFRSASKSCAQTVGGKNEMRTSPRRRSRAWRRCLEECSPLIRRRGSQRVKF